MKFVHPEILWALSALAIPIIVHLFNFRKFKKVFFPNVEFLKEIHQETQSKSKLKHLLILLARLLALACIVLAFAQPFIPVPGLSSKPGGTAVSVFIDNSFSMEARGSDGILLDLAKNKAIEIVGAYKPSDKFQLLTSDFEGRHQRLVSREEMIELIQEVQETPVSRKLSEIASRQRDMLLNSGMDNRRAYILSDLQLSMMDVGAITGDTTIRYSLIPEQAEERSNLFVDSVWFETPVRQMNHAEILHARIVNTGNDNRENLPVQLLVNGQQKSVAAANVEAEGSSEISITFTNTEPGYKNCILKIDDGSISKDDEYFFSYNVADKINILEIRGAAVEREAVQTVFSDDPYFNYGTSAENSIDFGLFSTQNLIVLNQLKTISSGLASELQSFASNGGSILIIPSAEIVLNEYNAALAGLGMSQISGKMISENKVTQVNFDHYIFRDAFEKVAGNLDLPGVKAYYEVVSGSRGKAEPMLVLQSGTPYMVSSSFGDGRIYLIASSLNVAESNFINHAFFPATLLRIAEYSQPASELEYRLGMQQAILLRNVKLTGEETFKLRSETDGAEFIPEHRNAGGNTEVFVHNDLRNAGNYSLRFGNEQVSALSFNYDRRESDNHTMSAETAQNELNAAGLVTWNVMNTSAESLAAGADEMHDTKKYWLTMIIWSLIFLAVEVLLIKFWR